MSDQKKKVKPYDLKPFQINKPAEKSSYIDAIKGIGKTNVGSGIIQSNKANEELFTPSLAREKGLGPYSAVCLATEIIRSENNPKLALNEYSFRQTFEEGDPEDPKSQYVYYKIFARVEELDAALEKPPSFKNFTLQDGAIAPTTVNSSEAVVEEYLSIMQHPYFIFAPPDSSKGDVTLEQTPPNKGDKIEVEFFSTKRSSGKVLRILERANNLESLGVGAFNVKDAFNQENTFLAGDPVLPQNGWQAPISANPRQDRPFSNAPLKNPVDGKSRKHLGLDYSAFQGTPVYAARAGKVNRSSERPSDSFGNVIEIYHPKDFMSGDINTYATRYAHLESIMVNKGDIVSVGTQIGTVGSTGRSTGPHLHFELAVNPDDPDLTQVGDLLRSGKRVDPLQYVGYTPQGRKEMLATNKQEDTFENQEDHSRES